MMELEITVYVMYFLIVYDFLIYFFCIRTEQIISKDSIYFTVYLYHGGLCVCVCGCAYEL